MAYLTLLASVSPEQIDALRTDPRVTLVPSLVGHASHVLSYWVQEQPLGSVLSDIVDGGELLSESLWHPLRPPRVHFPDKVSTLLTSCQEAWETYRKTVLDDDWLENEIRRLLAVLADATRIQNCFVTALDHPGDHERANRVRIPWLPHSKPARTKSWWQW